MTEEKLTPCNISRSEEAARYTLRKYGNRLPGIEHGFIIGCLLYTSDAADE